jgi:hypothetical protein
MTASVHPIAQHIEQAELSWRGRDQLVAALIEHLSPRYDTFRSADVVADLHVDDVVLLVRLDRADERVHVLADLTAAAADDVTGLIVVTTRPALMTLPVAVAGKPLRTILLPRPR